MLSSSVVVGVNGVALTIKYLIFFTTLILPIILAVVIIIHLRRRNHKIAKLEQRIEKLEPANFSLTPNKDNI